MVCLTLSDKFDAEVADAKDRWATRELFDAARLANWRRATSRKAIISSSKFDGTN